MYENNILCRTRKLIYQINNVRRFPLSGVHNSNININLSGPMECSIELLNSTLCNRKRVKIPFAGSIKMNKYVILNILKSDAI